MPMDALSDEPGSEPPAPPSRVPVPACLDMRAIPLVAGRLPRPVLLWMARVGGFHPPPGLRQPSDPRGARREVPVIIDSVLRAGEGKLLRKLKRISEQVNSIEDDFTAMSDDELRGMTDELRQRYAAGETLDDLLPEAFAAAREAAQRTLGQRP